MQALGVLVRAVPAFGMGVGEGHWLSCSWHLELRLLEQCFAVRVCFPFSFWRLKTMG